MWVLGSPQPPQTQHPPFPPHRVQELKLEEQQWQLDQKLRGYMDREGECRHVLGQGVPVHSGGGAGPGLWPPQPCSSPLLPQNP